MRGEIALRHLINGDFGLRDIDGRQRRAGAFDARQDVFIATKGKPGWAIADRDVLGDGGGEARAAGGRQTGAQGQVKLRAMGETFQA